MIITCERDGTLKCYDAITLLPLENKKMQKLYRFAANLSYSHENESFLVGRKSGSLYIYNTLTDELKKLQGCQNDVLAFEFLGSSFYAFSLYKSKELSIGTFENDNVSRFDLQGNNSSSLCFLPKRNLLLSGLTDGSMRINRTNKLPHARMFCSIWAHKFGPSGVLVQKTSINGKEYVMTTSRMSHNVKIWQFTKGRMRLLRVIHTEGDIDSLVYLEDYKMIAIAYEHLNGIGFFKLLSEKLEKTFGFNKESIRGLIFMKDKNMIGGRGGFPGLSMDSISFIQLDAKEETSCPLEKSGP